jgi:hypothetical protein
MSSNNKNKVIVNLQTKVKNLEKKLQHATSMWGSTQRVATGVVSGLTTAARKSRNMYSTATGSGGVWKRYIATDPPKDPKNYVQISRAMRDRYEKSDKKIRDFAAFQHARVDLMRNASVRLPRDTKNIKGSWEWGLGKTFDYTTNTMDSILREIAASKFSNNEKKNLVADASKNKRLSSNKIERSLAVLRPKTPGMHGIYDALRKRANLNEESKESILEILGKSQILMGINLDLLESGQTAMIPKSFLAKIYKSVPIGLVLPALVVPVLKVLLILLKYRWMFSAVTPAGAPAATFFALASAIRHGPALFRRDTPALAKKKTVQEFLGLEKKLVAQQREYMKSGTLNGKKTSKREYRIFYDDLIGLSKSLSIIKQYVPS